jgi:hypothetical protein
MLKFDIKIHHFLETELRRSFFARLEMTRKQLKQKIRRCGCGRLSNSNWDFIEEKSATTRSKA